MNSLISHAVLILALMFPLGAWAQVSVPVAPPPLPVYAQPPVPGDDYIWVPGYWAWNADSQDYYWVPGTWVLAPEDGYLWTPGYWSFDGAGYIWNPGYWGLQVGFYGGVNYGYGYTGSGYQGGRWEHGHFQYNRAVTNVGNMHNVYSASVHGGRNSHASFNGGHGGTMAKPSAGQHQFQAAQHAGPAPAQVQHERAALSTPAQRWSSPHPAQVVGATPRPSAFTAPGVEHIRGPMPGAGARPERGAGQEQRPREDAGMRH